MYQKIILIGNLGKDAEIKTTASGLSITKFSLATSEKYKDKNSGEYKNISTWFDITVFGKLGQVLVDYLSKGTMIYLEGKISLNSYDAKDGTKHSSLSVIASEIKLLKTNANAKPQTPEPKKKIDPHFDDGNDNPKVLEDLDDIIPF